MLIGIKTRNRLSFGVECPGEAKTYRGDVALTCVGV